LNFFGDSVYLTQL